MSTVLNPRKEREKKLKFWAFIQDFEYQCQWHREGRKCFGSSLLASYDVHAVLVDI